MTVARYREGHAMREGDGRRVASGSCVVRARRKAKADAPEPLMESRYEFAATSHRRCMCVSENVRV